MKGLGLRHVEPRPAPPVPALHWMPSGSIPVGAIIGPVEFVDWYPRWDRKTATSMALVSSLVAPWAAPWVAFSTELVVRNP